MASNECSALKLENKKLKESVSKAQKQAEDYYLKANELRIELKTAESHEAAFQESLNWHTNALTEARKDASKISKDHRKAERKVLYLKRVNAGLVVLCGIFGVALVGAGLAG